MAKPLAVELVALGGGSAGWLPDLGRQLSVALRCRWSMLPALPDLSFAYLPARAQFSSTQILLQLQELFGDDSPGRVVLGVADADLTVPIFTFVFGEAIHGGGCAVISGHRLRQQFYGLPADEALFEERLLKMAVHEIGHTRGLRHCGSYRCVMATSYAIERLDLKSAAFCPACDKELRAVSVNELKVMSYER